MRLFYSSLLGRHDFIHFCPIGDDDDAFVVLVSFTILDTMLLIIAVVIIDGFGGTKGMSERCPHLALALILLEQPAYQNQTAAAKENPDSPFARRISVSSKQPWIRSFNLRSPGRSSSPICCERTNFENI